MPGKVKQKQKRNFQSIVRIVLGAILILTGICWYLYPCYREWMTQQDVDNVIAEFEQQYAASDRSAADVPEQTQAPAFQDLYAEMSRYNKELARKGQKLTDAWDFEQATVDLSSLGSDNSAIGYIEVPDMGVRMPLYIGASPLNMSKGAAVLAGTSMPIGGENTNCVICGHRGWRGSAYFRNIEDMKDGSVVYITNPWGTMTYRAVSAKIIYSRELENIFIRNGRDMVTLFSCYPYAHSGTPYRYVVFCERVADVLPDNPESKDEPTTGAALKGNDNKEAAHMAAGEDILLFWEKCLRYILPVAAVAIVVLIRLIQKMTGKKQKKKAIGK